MLRVGGAALVSLSSVGTAVAAKDGKKQDGEKEKKEKNKWDLNMKFNPNDRGELKDFMQKFSKHERSEQKKIFKGLTKNRQKAVMESQKPVKVEKKTKNSSSETEPRVKPQQEIYAGESSDEVVYPAKTWYGTNAWKFHHSVEWEWDDSAEITNVFHSARASDVDFGWTYDGVNNGSKSKNVDLGTATVSLQGHFTYGAGDFASVYNVYPYSKLKARALFSNVEVVDNNCDCPNVG